MCPILYFFPFVQALAYAHSLKVPDSPCELLQTGDREFHRISAISKYVGFTNKLRIPEAQNYHHAIEICETAGLKIADVNNLLELNSLSSYVKGSIWIGMNNLRGGQDFQDGNGRDIIYQAFGIGNPDGPIGSSCVQLRRGEDHILRMYIEACLDKAGVLCQFPENSYCNGQSYQKTAYLFEDEFKEMIPLKNQKNVYVGRIQKSFDQAHASCFGSMKMPLFIEDNDQSMSLGENLASYIKSFGLDPETQFWTGGTIDYNEEGQYFGSIFWTPLGESYDLFFNPKNITFQWAMGEPRQMRYGGSYGCIDVSSPRGRLAQYQSSNCLVPKYYLCQDLDFTVSKGDFKARLQKMFVEEYTNGTYAKKKPSSQRSSNKACIPQIKSIDAITIKNLTQPLTLNQTLEIMIYSIKNTLKNGNVRVNVKKNLFWIREIIDNIFEIFMKAVPAEIIPWEFLSVAREVNLLYLNSFVDKKVNAKSDWDSVLGVLDTCLQNMRPYDFATQRLNVKFVKVLDSGIETLIPRMEEEIFNVDIVIDVLWHVFSFTLGACYPSSNSNQNRMIWAAEYYTLFVKDVMDKIMDKWINEDESNLKKAGLILGDIDLEITLRNLRAVTVAAYMQNKILELQVIRPIRSEINEMNNNFI